MPGDQSLAVVVPRNNSLSVFTNNFWRSKQHATNKEAKQAAAVKAKQDADEKLMSDITLLSTPEQQIQAKINENADATYTALRQAIREGKGPAEKQLIVMQGNGKNLALKAYGQTYATVEKDIQYRYNSLGLNGAASTISLRQHYLNPQNIGNADLSTAWDIAEKNADDYVMGNAASEKQFKTFGTRQETTKRNANGVRTASSKSYTLPNDAEVVDVNGQEMIVPKSETFIADNANTQAEIKAGGKNTDRALAQVSLASIQNSKNGSINLYDKEAYDVLMKNEAARREGQKDFNQYVRDYEAANPGKKFPKDGELEDVAKRAIVFKKRALGIDSKMSETIAGPQYHISVNAGGGKGSGTGQGEIPLNDQYERLVEAVKPKRNMLGFPYNPEVPVNNLEAVVGD